MNRTPENTPDLTRARELCESAGPRSPFYNSTEWTEARVAEELRNLGNVKVEAVTRDTVLQLPVCETPGAELTRKNISIGDWGDIYNAEEGLSYITSDISDRSLFLVSWDGPALQLVGVELNGRTIATMENHVVKDINGDHIGDYIFVNYEQDYSAILAINSPVVYTEN